MVERLGGHWQVFNLEVEGVHSYFVAGRGGRTAVWVHNSGASPLEPGAITGHVENLRAGRDVQVQTIEQARQLLEAMPDLRPHTQAGKMPVPPGEGLGGNPLPCGSYGVSLGGPTAET